MKYRKYGKNDGKYGKTVKEILAEEKLIFINPSMKKLCELPCGDTDWRKYKYLSKEMLDQSNFKEYKKSDITKVYNFATKLIDDYLDETYKRLEKLRKENVNKNLQNDDDGLFL